MGMCCNSLAPLDSTGGGHSDYSTLSISNIQCSTQLKKIIKKYANLLKAPVNPHHIANIYKRLSPMIKLK